MQMYLYIVFFYSHNNFIFVPFNYLLYLCLEMYYKK